MTVQGILRVAVERGTERKVAAALARVPGIVEIVPHFGEYDYTVTLEGATGRDLADVVRAHVRPLPGVRSAVLRACLPDAPRPPSPWAHATGASSADATTA